MENGLNNRITVAEAYLRLVSEYLWNIPIIATYALMCVDDRDSNVALLKNSMLYLIHRTLLALLLYIWNTKTKCKCKSTIIQQTATHCTRWCISTWCCSVAEAFRNVIYLAFSPHYPIHKQALIYNYIFSSYHNRYLVNT